MRLAITDQWIARLVRYALAPLAVLLALAITVAIPALRNQNVTSLFFAAVMITSWLAGLGPGLTATVLSLFLIELFIVGPAFSLTFGFEDIVRSLVFVLVAFLISWLNTARRRLESESRRQALQLTQQDQARNAFLALLAHELRNGLAPVANGANVLKRTATEQQGPVVEILERQTSHLSQIVHDLLDLSRLGQGKLRLRMKPVDVNSLVEHVVTSLRNSIEEREHQLTLSLSEESLWVIGDQVRLEQVVLNLLTNAIKYTPHAGKIDLSLFRSNSQVVLRVRDNGIGISQELLPRVFDPFAQGEHAESEGEDGLGLGLVLVRGIIERHRGHVAVTSGGVGRGCEFTVQLPAASPEQHPAVEPSIATNR